MFECISPQVIVPVALFIASFAFSAGMVDWGWEWGGKCEIRNLQPSEGHFLLQQLLVTGHRDVPLNRSMRKS